MKSVLFLSVLLISTAATARDLQARIKCSCQTWGVDEAGNMKARTAHIGSGTWAKLTDKFALSLVTKPFAQQADHQQGYFSMTPALAKFFSPKESMFDDGGSAVEYVRNSCKQTQSEDEDLFNCAVTIVIPINDTAKKIAQEK